MKVGIIGIGNMGGALLKAFSKSDVLKPKDLAISTLTSDGEQLALDLGVQVFANNVELVNFADVIVVAVKPKDVKEVLESVRTPLKNKALISVAAGLKYAELQTWVDDSTRILAALPNTPVSVGAGAIGFATETTFTDSEKKFSEELLASCAKVFWVQESQLGALSAISGSGPAFTALFVEALADAGVKRGLPRNLALDLAAQTVCGTGKQILDTHIHPAILKDAVCSPGGTSIQGIATLEAGGFRSAIIDAVDVTTKAWG